MIFSWHFKQLDGVVAQLVERYNGIVEVRGSIPLSSTRILLVNDNASGTRVTKPKSVILCVWRGL